MPKIPGGEMRNPGETFKISPGFFRVSSDDWGKNIIIPLEEGYGSFWAEWG